MQEINKNILKEIYKKRPYDAKKYDYGLLVVIGGSELYSGSPALSAMAAFSAGADMVHVIAPKRAADIIASFSPNIAAYPLEGMLLEMRHLPTLLSLSESAKAVARGNAAVVIGGGLGRSEETQQTVLEFLNQTSLPAVIDADAIHALGHKPHVIFEKKFLITPHTYEFFVLTKKEVYKLPEEEKIKAVKHEASQLKTTVLLKGPTDIISDGERIALSRTGSPLMTKGGMGDTLAGIAGALMARGIDAFSAGQAAAYINGAAGELAAKRLGEAVKATDLIADIQRVLPRP